jgi:hypothetical protein
VAVAVIIIREPAVDHQRVPVVGRAREPVREPVDRQVAIGGLAERPRLTLAVETLGIGLVEPCGRFPARSRKRPAKAHIPTASVIAHLPRAALQAGGRQFESATAHRLSHAG